MRAKSRPSELLYPRHRRDPHSCGPVACLRGESGSQKEASDILVQYEARGASSHNRRRGRIARSGSAVASGLGELPSPRRLDEVQRWSSKCLSG